MDAEKPQKSQKYPSHIIVAVAGDIPLVGLLIHSRYQEQIYNPSDKK